MTYQETYQWLLQQLPMFQNSGVVAYKANLDNIISFTEKLGNPHQKFKSIHIAGTNGKGSTSHMLASIFQEAGYKTGLHTSPHLKDFRERSRINGIMMPESFVIDFVNKHQVLIEQQKASFFEVSVAMAFSYFAQENVDIAIIETGLGGRLDSTNIIKPEVSVITNIGLDHTHILGETLQDIALEKAGIIKPNTPIIIGEVLEETKEAFEYKADTQNAPIFFAEDYKTQKYLSDLKGLYQKKNIQTAAAAISVLKDLGWNFSKKNIQDGFAHVVKNTGLRGRWDVLQQNPMVVADTAHNASGIQYVIRQIKDTPHQQLHLVLGFVNDKDVKTILQYFPQDALFYLCEPNIPRKMKLEDLKNLVPDYLKAQYYPTVSQALQAAKNHARQDDFIYIGGSTFVVAEVI